MDPVDFRISRSAVEGLSDEAVCEEVVYPIWPDSHEDNEAELARIAKGTPGQQAIYSTMIFAREVDNGGVSQFLRNSSGMYWRHVVAGLQLLGAHEHLSALSAALSFFPGGEPPLNRSERQSVWRNLDANLKAMISAAEKRVFQAGGFEQLLVPKWKAYIDSHPEEFFS